MTGFTTLKLPKHDTELEKVSFTLYSLLGNLMQIKLDPTIIS